jgi:arylsulfatase A-like enzyme
MRFCRTFSVASIAVPGAGTTLAALPALAQQAARPNIILIVSDDFGYGDAGVCGGGPGRGRPTPNIDRMADEGETFFSFHAQPSCTPGRAAMQTGRYPQERDDIFMNNCTEHA